MAYATIEELQNRWRVLTVEETSRAETALTDASVQLRRDVPTLAARLAAEALQAPPGQTGDLAHTASQVVCAMVRRAMDVDSEGGFGVTATQETRGPFSRSRNYANPMGDLYTTKAERRRLSADGDRQEAYSIDMGPDPVPYVLDLLP